MRLQQVREGRERQLHLRAGRPTGEDGEPGFPRSIDRRLPQGGLAGPGRTIDDQRARQGGAVGKERLDRLELGLAPHHPGRDRVHGAIMAGERTRCQALNAPLAARVGQLVWVATLSSARRRP